MKIMFTRTRFDMRVDLCGRLAVTKPSEKGRIMSITVDTLAAQIQDSVTDAEVTREEWESALDQVFPREVREASRFWVQDSVVEDTPDIPMPFGADTVGIVDEDEGGVILYLHKDSADAVIESLRAAAGTW